MNKRRSSKIGWFMTCAPGPCLVSLGGCVSSTGGATWQPIDFIAEFARTLLAAYLF